MVKEENSLLFRYGGSGRYGGDRLGGSDNHYSGGSDRSSSYRGFGSGGSFIRFCRIWFRPFTVKWKEQLWWFWIERS